MQAGSAGGARGRAARLLKARGGGGGAGLASLRRLRLALHQPPQVETGASYHDGRATLLHREGGGGGGRGLAKDRGTDAEAREDQQGAASARRAAPKRAQRLMGGSAREAAAGL